MDSEPTDKDLLSQLSTDPAAFETFYWRHLDRVIGFTARRVREPADVADVVVPAHLSADYLVDHVKAAVNASADSAIQYDLGQAPNSQTGVIENTATWDYATAGRKVTLTHILGAGGSPAFGYLMTATSDKTVTITINYGNRTWSTTTYPWGYETPPNTPGPLPQTTAQAADALRAAISAGSMTDAGPAEVDGQRAIHLVQGSAKTGEIDMWVDPGTYLPIRTIETGPGESVASDRAIRDDYQWLPDTAANLSLLTPAGAIPAGFTQVPNAGAGGWAQGLGAGVGRRGLGAGVRRRG
jgi:hypothetical protein